MPKLKAAWGGKRPAHERLRMDVRISTGILSQSELWFAVARKV